MHPRVLPIFALAFAALASGCHRADTEARAEAARLRRQIRALRALSQGAEKGSLFPNDQLAVGISEKLVRDTLRAQLPRETVVLDQFRATISDADVHFDDGQSLVVLQARIAPQASPATFADFTLTGGLDDIDVDPDSGFLRGRVALDRVDLRQVATEPLAPGVARTFLEGLGGRGLGAIGEVVAPLEIPMRLTRSVESRGIDDGRVFVPPARLSFRCGVKRVMPLSGRLFVLLDVKTGS